MSTYPIQQLLDLWEKGKLTVEQAIGHIFQHLDGQRARVNELARRVRDLEQKFDSDA